MPALPAQIRISALLTYCRAGFEQESAAELHDQLAPLDLSANFTVIANSAYVLCEFAQPQAASRLTSIAWTQLIFARQLLWVVGDIGNLPNRDRLTPIVAALEALPLQYDDLWLETPDTNDGKTLSGFCRRFAPLLEAPLAEKRLLRRDQVGLPRLHLFFPQQERCLIALSVAGNRSDWPMGIPRLKMPFEAPSRSTLKLAEALLTLLDETTQRRLLKPGMRAVDLGAAPGGWTWQLANRGLRVTAVDNGPLKGAVRDDPLVEHVRADGFKYRPRKPVDWMVCDMVEQPVRITQLVCDWLIQGWARQVVFNLKLPMKKRYQEIQRCFAQLDQKLHKAGIDYQLHARQLYHDREEITVYLGRKG